MIRRGQIFFLKYFKHFFCIEHMNIIVYLKHLLLYVSNFIGTYAKSNVSYGPVPFWKILRLWNITINKQTKRA